MVASPGVKVRGALLSRAVLVKLLEREGVF